MTNRLRPLKLTGKGLVKVLLDEMYWLPVAKPMTGKRLLSASENLSCYAEGYNRSLASIPVNNANSSVIYYSNLTNHRNTFYQHNVNQIQIDIFDDYQNLINFNNIDWSMTLQIDTVSEQIRDLGTLKEVYDSELIGEF